MLTSNHANGSAKGIFESMPSIAFALLLRANINLETAGWIGAALATIVLFVFYIKGIVPNPILLGINLHLLVITPLIVSTFALGHADIGNILIQHSYRRVLITVLLVGSALTFLTKRGFIGLDGLSPALAKSNSYVLLAATGLATMIAYSNIGREFVQVLVAFLILFLTRRVLIARLEPKI